MFNTTPTKRKSLIPQPGFSHSRKSSPHITPNNSPTKLHVDISPSSIPVYANAANGMSVKRKPSTDSLPLSVNEYLDQLQTHLSEDINSERIVLSRMNEEIELKSQLKYKLINEIKTLTSKNSKVADFVLEYQSGINVKINELNNLKHEINKSKLNMITKKNDLDLQFRLKEDKVLLEMKKLLEDANEVDEDTLSYYTDRIDNLKKRKEDLLLEIEQAKSKMDMLLNELELDMKNEKKTIETTFKMQLEEMETEFSTVQKKYDVLVSQLDEIKSSHELKEKQIADLELQIEGKKANIDKLTFRITDLKTLIDDFSHDLQNISSMCTDFENTEYKSAREKFETVSRNLSRERFKRMKIEFQIKELSGIPNLTLINPGPIFAKSSLSEFIKPSDYDWKSELFIDLESSLNGISSVVINFLPNYKVFHEDLEAHLKEVVKQDRFRSYNRIQIQYLDTVQKISDKIPSSIASTLEFFPLSTAAVYTELENKFITKKAIVILLDVNSPDQLSVLKSSFFGKFKKKMLIASADDSWLPGIQEFVALKLVSTRDSYSLLN